MIQPISRRLAVGAALALTALLGATVATAGESAESALTPQQAQDLAKLAVQITDAVLDHHLDPPARQQMLLDGMKALYDKAHEPVPSGLSRRVSGLTTPEQLAGLILELKPKPASKPISFQDLESTFRSGLLQCVGGEADLISAKDRRVAEQIEGNRYVGLHIALGTDDQEKRPKMHEVIEGGPADKAGVKKDDILEQIDGVDTKGMNLREAVNRLRGEDGTIVTIVVRQPKEQQSRTMKIARGMLPRTTVSGIRRRSSGEWDVRLNGPDAIGYLRINDLTASTPHELRKLAQQIESEGIRSIVIDLRGAVLQGCPSGRAGGRCAPRSRNDRSRADGPAVADVRGRCGRTIPRLADGGIGRPFHVRDRGVACGCPGRQSSGDPGRRPRSRGPESVDVRTTVPVGDGTWSLTLVTGYLERRNGQLLGARAFEEPGGARGRRRLPAPDLTKADEQPDRSSPKTPSRKTVARPKDDRSVGAQQPASENNIASDPAVGEAIRLLRELQKKKT